MKYANTVHFGAAVMLALAPAMAHADSMQQPSSGSRAGSSMQTPPGQSAGNTASATSGTVNDDLQLQGAQPDISQMRRGRALRIDQSFNRQANNGCTYQSTVHGTVQEYLPRTASAQGMDTQGAAPGTQGAQGGNIDFNAQNQGASAQNVFVPNLAVNAQVQCPHSASQHLTVATLAGIPLTKQQLEIAVAQRARVLNIATNRVCTYSPQFSFDNGRIAGRSLVQTCVAAVGGGPRDVDSQGGANGANVPSDQPVPDQGTNSGGAMQ